MASKDYTCTRVLPHMVCQKIDCPPLKHQQPIMLSINLLCYTAVLKKFIYELCSQLCSNFLPQLSCLTNSFAISVAI